MRNEKGNDDENGENHDNNDTMHYEFRNELASPSDGSLSNSTHIKNKPLNKVHTLRCTAGQFYCIYN